MISESPVNGSRNINNTSSPTSDKSSDQLATLEKNPYQSLFANSLTNGNKSKNNGSATYQQPQYSEVLKTPSNTPSTSPASVVPLM